MKYPTETVYFKSCRCGHRLEMRRRQAGSWVICPECQETNQVESLSQLHRLPNVVKKLPTQSPFQMSISTLFKWSALFAVVCAIGSNFGWKPILFLFLPAAFYVLFLTVVAFVFHRVADWRNRFWDFWERKSNG